MSDPASDPDPLLPLAEEFAERYRRGERPTLTEYAEKHPELAERIRRLFPALAVMEELGSAAGEPTGPFGPVAGTGPAPPRLGDFRLLREVGRGGMGVVYEAVQESLGRHVALKLLPAHGLLSPTQRQRFEREAKAAARLHHTHIVPVYGVGEADGVPYYAMQFIQGQSADGLLRQLRRLRPAPAGGQAGEPADTVPAGAEPAAAPEGAAPGPSASGLSELSGRSGAEYARSVARVGVQAAEALAHAHAQGVLHRDIKPANLLIDTQGAVWITDFGLAKLEGSDDLTGEGEVPGTLRYMAPERFAGRADARSDVYSLGLTLYELLTLRPAFVAGTRGELIERILHAEPPRPRAIDSHLPRDLEAVILKAAAKEPAERYQAAQELADDLRRFLDDLAVHARRPTVLHHLRRWMRRRRAVVATAAAGLLAAVLVLAGSVGWALQGRIAREKQVTGQVEAALGDVVDSLQAGRWAEVRGALQKARALGDRGATGAQRQQIEALEKDLGMAERLEAIRLNHAALRKDAFASARTDESYARAFRDYGIDVDALSPDEAGERMRARPIGATLALALDAWAAIRWGLAERGGPRWRDLRWRQLLAAARLADPDPARDRVRDALAPGRKGTRALKELAAPYRADADAARQGPDLPAQTAVFFAEALSVAGEHEAAVAVLRQAQKLHPGDFWVNFNLAVVLQDGGQLDEAICYYTAAAALHPDNALVPAGLGAALADKGKHREAVAVLRGALDKAPDLAIAHTNLGNVLAEKGDLPGALFHLRKAIALEPGISGFYHNLGAALHDQAQLDAALAAFSSPPGRWAGVSFSVVRLDAALAAYSKALEVAPGNAYAHFNRGLLLKELGRVKEAVADFQMAAATAPSFAQAHFHLGRALEKQGKLPEAEDAFGRAVACARPGAGGLFRRAGRNIVVSGRALRPAEAHFALARVRWKRNRLPEAEDACRKAIAACREELDARYNIESQHDLGQSYDLLGRILVDQRKSAEAEASFREAAAAQVQAIRMKPTADQARDIRHSLARAHHHRGKALMALRKSTEAEAACREALAGLPQDEAAGAHFLLGLLLEQQGNLGEAEAVLGRVINAWVQPIEGDDTDRKHDLGHAYRVLARVLHKRGKNAEAEAAVNRAIAVLTPLTLGKPGTPGPGCELAGAYGLLGKLRQDLGRLPQAQEAHRQAVALAEKLVQDFPGEPSQEALAGALNDLGGSHPDEVHPDAEAILRRACKLWRGLAEKRPEEADYREGLAMASSNLGGLLLQKGQYAEAEQLVGDAVRLRRELLSKEGRSSAARLWLAGDLSRQARLLVAVGRRPEVERALDEAEGLLRPLVQQFPTIPIYKRALAENHFNRGRLLEDTGSAGAERAFLQARDLFEELVKEHPEEPNYTRELASSLNSLGRARMRADSADAERILRRALKLWEALVGKYRDVPGYRKHLAVCCSNLSLLLERNPRRVAEARHFTMRAFDLFEKLAGDYPGVPQYQSDLAGELHNVAFVLRDRGRLPEARAHMERAIKKQQAALDAVGGRHARYRKQLWTHYWGLTEILIALEDHAGASRAVENMPSIDGGWEACYRAVPLLARCAVLAGKDDKLPPAERQRLYRSHVGRIKELLAEALKRIAAGRPQTDEQRQKLAEGALSVGNAFFDLGETERAGQCYETAVELCPRLAAAHYRKGGILYCQRALPGAAASFRQAITLRPEYAEAHEGLAMTLAGQGKVDDAVAAYRKAGELYTDRAQAARLYINLGTLLARSRRLPEAEDAFRKAVELQPKSAEVHYSLGLALGQQGKRKEAIASWRKAVEVKPDCAPAWANLGFALHKGGRNGEALKALRQARKLLPADDPARPRIDALIRDIERLAEPGKG